MPNRQVHRNFGRMSGAGAAAYNARNETPVNFLIETFGGYFAGDLASSLPDRFDPPTSPNHRGLGHSLALNSVAHAKIIPASKECQLRLRNWANEIAEMRPDGGPLLDWFISVAFELVLRLLSGAIPGAIAGHASHLVLDMGTPKALPLIN